MKRLVVFISGRGSNMQAIVNACTSGVLDAEVVAVISDQPDAAGLAWASEQGLDARCVPRGDYSSKAEHQAALLSAANDTNPDWILLAGFMRILSPEFIAGAAAPIVNIHPSRLPKYKGLDTHQRCLDAGDTLHGASVHIVTAELDDGPVIAQSCVEVLPQDDAESLAARVLKTEHPLYIFSIHKLLTDAVEYSDGHLIPGDLCEPLPLQFSES